MKTFPKNTLAFLAAALALIGAPAARSQSLTFNVNLQTSGLSAESADAPFYLDFQMDYGNVALASNTVTLSNFTFTNGGTIGPDITSGLVTGSLATSAVLTASSTHPFSELTQEFSPGVTDIDFTATVTEAGPDIGTPTEFSASILDSSLGGPGGAEIFTTAPDTESLVTLDLSSSNTINNVNTYSGISSADGEIALTGVRASVPDATSTAALTIGAILIMVLISRRVGRAAAA
ncbi:MAG TPA: hypothetical protein VIJ19_05760 [Opitutaceae bacterium]